MRNNLLHGQRDSKFAATSASISTARRRPDANDFSHDQPVGHASDVPWQPTMMDQSSWLARREWAFETSDERTLQGMPLACVPHGGGRR